MQTNILASERIQNEIEYVKERFEIRINDEYEILIYHFMQNMCHFVDDMPMLKDKKIVDLFDEILNKNQKVLYTKCIDQIIVAYISLLCLRKR